MPSPYTLALDSASYVFAFKTSTADYGLSPTKAAYVFSFPSTGVTFATGGGAHLSVTAGTPHAFSFKTVEFGGALLSTRNVYIPLIHKERTKWPIAS